MTKAPDKFLDLAIKTAVEGHSGQFDRGGNPYILHCLAVMHLVESTESEVRQIAVMHDLIEDTKLTYKELLALGFSSRVVEGVKALTKVPGEDYDEYLSRVSTNRDATLVKLADLTHNTDIRRLKGATEKDIMRTAKYYTAFLHLRAIKESWNEKN
jgi:(p)ppGpp synthase/HD superfamily hydrolase